MATPKEQHDARPNARNIGRLHERALPADATPPGGIRALTLDDLEPRETTDAPRAATRDATRGDAPPSREPAERA
jgi:hypothetical protein